jgi:glycosyltransferase involved in cell wall biosynthesis
MDASAGGIRGALFRAHQRVALPLLLAQANRILVSSLDYAHASSAADHLTRLPRVQAQAFGVDSDRFRPGHEPLLRSAIGVAGDEPVLLFVSALDPAHYFKGLPVLVEALRTLVDARWRLVVVGDGPARPQYEELARNVGLDHRIHFAGDVSDVDLPRYYRAADVHLFPSTGTSEAFGLVCLEAAASGIPTIASRLPGVRTVVLDRETGLHVTPRDATELSAAVRLLLERPDLRDQLGRAARQRAVTEFDWESRIDDLERVYDEVLASTTASEPVVAV